jgi:hypothetical protein
MTWSHLKVVLAFGRAVETIFILPVFALRAKTGNSRTEDTLLPQAMNHIVVAIIFILPIFRPASENWQQENVKYLAAAG